MMAKERGTYEAKRARTRRQILDAAQRAFASTGYHETTMGDIAAAAGVVPSTVTNHFPTKEAIGLALVDEWLESFVEVQFDARAAINDPAVRVALTVLRLFTLADEQGPVSEVLATGFPTSVADFRGRLAHLATGNLTEGIERGRFRVRWSQSVLDFITGLTVETMRSRRLGVLDEAAPEDVARIALGGLGLPADEFDDVWAEARRFHEAESERLALTTAGEAP